MAAAERYGALVFGGARGARRGRARGRDRRAGLGAAPGRAALSRARRGRADHRLPAGAVLGGRDLHHARHRALAADRERALLRARAAARVPVRPQLGAADRDPRGPGGGRRRVRRGAGVLGHHHGQRGRDDRRPADRHLRGDLHGRVREPRACAPWSSRCSRSSPASRRSSTASSRCWWSRRRCAASAPRSASTSRRPRRSCRAR